ncbi:MAG: DUF4097 family beta strand repeat protein [Myxococcales bacterium]|nr:DUF4097 family beta strand repeat protein [Myxococcales bacterium]
MTSRFLSFRFLGSTLAAAMLLPGCVIELDGDLGAEIRDELDGACWGSSSSSSERIVVGEAVTAVVVDGGVGDVRVRTHGEAGAIVSAELFGDGGQVRPRVELDGSVLHVGVHCGRADCCAADLDLTIPAAASLEVELGVGDVSVQDLAGSAMVDLGTGDIELHRLEGGLDLHTGTGSIDGEGLLGAEAWVDVGTGDAELQWSSSATIESIDVEVGVGSVELEVPEGGYDLRLDTGVGDIDTDGIRGDAAGATITVDVGTGDIDLVGR